MGQGFESLQACHKLYMVGIAQLAEHRIVVPGVVGSSPITHPILWLRAGASAPAFASLPILGCSQVVRHGTLTPAFAGSSPAIPATRPRKFRIICPGLRPGLIHSTARPLPTKPGGRLCGGPIGVLSTLFSPRSLKDVFAGSPTSLSDPVAQLVEQRPFKAKVRGSSPRWVTITRRYEHSLW